MVCSFCRADALATRARGCSNAARLALTFAPATRLPTPPCAPPLPFALPAQPCLTLRIAGRLDGRTQLRYALFVRITGPPYVPFVPRTVLRVYPRTLTPPAACRRRRRPSSVPGQTPLTPYLALPALCLPPSLPYLMPGLYLMPPCRRPCLRLDVGCWFLRFDSGLLAPAAPSAYTQRPRPLARLTPQPCLPSPAFRLPSAPATLANSLAALPPCQPYRDQPAPSFPIPSLTSLCNLITLPWLGLVLVILV